MNCNYSDKTVTFWNETEYYYKVKDCMCSFFGSYFKDALSKSSEDFIAWLKRCHIWSVHFSPKGFLIEAISSKGVYIELKNEKFKTKLTWKKTSELLRLWARQAQNKEDFTMAALEMRKTGLKVSGLADTKNIDLDKIAAENADSVIEISVKEIEEYKYKGKLQPFGVRDDEVRVLADSFDIYGQLTPCAVREYKNGKYQMISGHKRLAAARKLGLETLKCIIIDCDDKTAFELVKHFNISRDKPLPSEICKLVEQTKNIKKEGDESDLTVTEIANLFGVGRNHIYRCYNLRNLPKAYAEAADREIIAPAELEKIINGIMSEHIAEFGCWLEYQEKKVPGSKLKKIFEFSAQCAENGEDFSVDGINAWLDNYDNKKAAETDEAGSDNVDSGEITVDFKSFLAGARSKYPSLLEKSDDDILSLLDDLLSEHYGKSE